MGIRLLWPPELISWQLLFKPRNPGGSTWPETLGVREVWSGNKNSGFYRWKIWMWERWFLFFLNKRHRFSRMAFWEAWSSLGTLCAERQPRVEKCACVQEDPPQFGQENAVTGCLRYYAVCRESKAWALHGNYFIPMVWVSNTLLGLWELELPGGVCGSAWSSIKPHLLRWHRDQ